MIIDETNYIEELKKKNEDALVYIVDRYGNLMKSVIHRNMPCLQNKQEDCLNEVLLAIWENSSSYDPEKNSFKNWIAAVAKYKAIDYMRKYRHDMENVSMDQEGMDEILNGKVSSQDVEKEILEKEISTRTQQLLDCLKPKDKELMLRLYVQEETVDSVSKSMKIDRSVLYNRISRAKKRIQKMYYEEKRS